MVDRVLGGGGTPGSTIIPSMYANLHLDPANPYGYDPEKAKSLLDAAGYKVGSDGIRADSKGNRLSFRLFGRTDSSGNNSQKAVQFLKGYLNAVGVEVTTKMVASDNLTTLIGEGKFDMFEWGWVVEPDPNYQLSTFTCASRSYKDGGSVYANLSESFYCNKEFDALYKKQTEQIDADQRAETVKAMQKMLYDDVPYVVTAYYDNLEAYRSDRFTNFKPQPEPKGSLLFQYGTYSYKSIEPVSAEKKKSAAAKEESSNSGLVVASVVGGAVLIGAAVFFGLSRRRRPDSEVE